MQRFTLVPGSWAGTGLRIAYDAEQEKLVVNGRVSRLSATQYTLVLALLQQMVRFQQGTSGRPYVRFTELLRLMGTQSSGALHAQMSEARAKLEPFGLGIENVRERGYLICGLSEEG